MLGVRSKTTLCCVLGVARAMEIKLAACEDLPQSPHMAAETRALAPKSPKIQGHGCLWELANVSARARCVHERAREGYCSLVVSVLGSRLHRASIAALSAAYHVCLCRSWSAVAEENPHQHAISNPAIG
jgi:hypothetical protein